VLRESLIPAGYIDYTEDELMALPTKTIFNHMRYIDQQADMVVKETKKRQKEIDAEAKKKRK